MGEILLGDCIELLSAMPANSIDSLVTDPPYGWRFMGKAWDAFTDSDGNQAFQDWTLAWAREALRVLKPGGHAVIFCGPRTYHRMACGVENAGFEVRDQLQWLFGSGFPKSLNIAVAIDKCQGAIGHRGKGFNVAGQNVRLNQNKELRSDHPDYKKPRSKTDAAKEWEGWGTALKPANEPILLARKPLSEKTVAANVLKWGVGGLNIDASRIEGYIPTTIQGQSSRQGEVYGRDQRNQKLFTPSASGRFPANLVLDEEAARALDAQSGVLKNGGQNYKGGDRSSIFGKAKVVNPTTFAGDTGGASRFFYVAKASKREKSVDNTHPTVKPIRLMEYLIRLVTPKGGKVLDPFLGSGTTGIAAKRLGFEFIGIEKEKEYIKIARKRIKEFHYDKVDQQCPSSKEKAVIPQADQDTVLQMKFEWS